MILLNPSISLFSAFIFSILVSFSFFHISFLFPILLVLYYKRKFILEILKKVLFLNLFIFVLFLFLLFESTFLEALNIYIRTNAIIIFNLALFHSSKGYDIVRALSMMKFPSVFVSSTYFTLKMIEILFSDFKNIKSTLKSRGFKANTSLFTYYTFGNVLGMLFVKSIRKSQALQDSFIARGFKGKIYLNDDFITSRFDFYLILSVVLSLIIKVVL